MWKASKYFGASCSNAFGDYQDTFPKVTIDVCLSPQATGINETFEESGLQVEKVG